MTNQALTVTTRVENPTPTIDITDGVDFDAEIQIIDETGETYRWVGSLTFAPVGDSINCWLSGELVKAIETKWVAAHKPLVTAIVKSLHHGAGVKTFKFKI